VILYVCVLAGRVNAMANLLQRGVAWITLKAGKKNTTERCLLGA
jgi:hypothetical protein